MPLKKPLRADPPGIAWDAAEVGTPGIMRPVTSRFLPPMLCAALALVGCTSTNGSSGQGTSTSSTTSSSSTTESARAECVAVGEKASELLTAVGGLADGSTTVEQVRTVAGELSDSIEDAASAIGPDAGVHLDAAKQALQRVLTALGTQPVDTAGLRGAAGDLVAALGNA